jgi:outer membrane protein OmpA-like peptidoglycan-associated protein
LSNLLADERDDIVAATPPGLLNFVNNSTAAPDPFDVLRAKIAARTPTYQPATARHGGRWMWPAAGVAAVALSWFVVTRWRGRDENPVTGVFDSPVSEAGSALRASAGEVGGTFGSLGTLVTRKLRDGIALSIPERGIESKLIAFIEDHTRPVSDTAWFNFDRLSFAKDSATILPESQEQLNNIAAVLEAYPDVNVKVGGYADNVGGAAANLQLSQRRADAVRQALIDRKVAASRIQSEGYGETHPLAPNSTEAGRALNRRIALRVTKK